MTSPETTTNNIFKSKEKSNTKLINNSEEDKTTNKHQGDLDKIQDQILDLVELDLVLELDLALELDLILDPTQDLVELGSRKGKTEMAREMIF